MSEQPYIFKSDFLPQTERSYPVPVVQARKMRGIYGPGLSQVVFMTEGWRDRNRRPFDTLSFPNVESHTDVPVLDQDELMQIVLARLYYHNQDEGKEIKYACKFVLKRERNKTDERWITFKLDVALDEEEEETEDDDEDEEERMDRRERSRRFRERYSPRRMQLEEEVGLTIDNAMGQFLHGVIEFQGEMREDVRMSRVHTNKILEQLFKVATSISQHQDNQARVNQAGWDALHLGLQMQKDVHGDVVELREKVAALETENEGLRKESKDTSRNSLLGTVIPLALKAAGQFMGGGNMAKALASSMPEPEAVAQVMNHAGLSQDPPTQGQTQPQAKSVDIYDLCTETEIVHHPLTCLSRLLGASLGEGQDVALKKALSESEWAALVETFGAKDDEEASMGMMKFFISFQNDDGTRYKLIVQSLTPFQRYVLEQATERATAKLQNQTLPPLDPSHFSSKPRATTIIRQEPVTVEAKEEEVPQERRRSRLRSRRRSGQAEAE